MKKFQVEFVPRCKQRNRVVLFSQASTKKRKILNLFFQGKFYLKNTLQLEISFEAILAIRLLYTFEQQKITHFLFSLSLSLSTLNAYFSISTMPPSLIASHSLSLSLLVVASNTHIILSLSPFHFQCYI